MITELERDGVPPLVVAFYRMAITSALLTPAAMIFRRTEIRSLLKQGLGLLVLSGFCLAVHFGAWIASLKYIPISTSVVLVSSHPFLVVAASYFILHEKPTRISLVGIAIGFLGTAAICWAGIRDAGLVLSGDSLALLGAVALVGYVIIGRKIRARVSLLAYVAPLYCICSIFLLAGVVVAGDRLYPYGGSHWTYFALLAVVPTILGHTVLNWALRYVPASVVSVAFLGEPVVASMLAFLFFGQVPAISTVVGGILVLVGIYLSTFSSRPNRTD